MKIILLICGLVAIASARSVTKNNRDENIEPLRRETFVTKLDHFTPQDGKTVKFNYTINPRHFEVNDAPFFININSGENDDITWLYNGLIHEISKEVNGAVINFNARYFENNIPVPDLSYDNLKYLTVEQSLADIAALIIHIREHYNSSNSRIILTGSGYGGTLAVLARQKYPHLVYGVWSSSGLFERHVYSKEQFEQVSHLIREHGGSDCADHVEMAFEEVEDHLIQFDVYYIQEIFDTCMYVMPYFEDEMAMFFSGLATYIIDFINIHHMEGIHEFCDAIEQDEIGSPKHLNFANWVTTHFGFGECLDYDYESRITKLLNTSLASPTVKSGELQRLYLECTQLGTHPISVNGDTLFGRRVAQDYYYYLCGDVFGNRFDYEQLKTAVKDYNINYGGKLPHITNAIFSNGLLDSDYAFGITADEEEWDAYVINIPEVGKSADFMENSENDAPSLVLAKYSIEQLLVEWCRRD